MVQEGNAEAMIEQCAYEIRQLKLIRESWDLDPHAHLHFGVLRVPVVHGCQGV